tara:strand:+ start:7334 stop:7615 length:282 start_codon:yes stop_codon:yes gene_type:complete
MRRSSKFIFADEVARMLIENPKGMSSYEIYNKLVDDNFKWLPSRNTIGSRLSAIGGFEAIGVTTGYSLRTTREVTMWTLDLKKFNAWRYKDAR